MRPDSRSNVGLPREATNTPSRELHDGSSTRVEANDLLPFDGQQNKNGPPGRYLAAATRRALAGTGKGARLMDSIPHFAPVGVNERQALSSWQALQVVQAALLEIESGRDLSDAGRRRAFEALAAVAQAVAS